MWANRTTERVDGMGLAPGLNHTNPLLLLLLLFLPFLLTGNIQHT
jgi:hypothetical protein